MRRSLGGLLGGAVAAAGVVGSVVWAPAVGAAAPAEVSAVGWWSRRPGAAPQPPGGFEVAAGLDGPESVAALRVAVGAPLARAVLVLGEREGLFHEQAVVRVCPAADGWSAANPGPFEQAPAADCARNAVLTRNAAQANWTADVTALLPAGGTVSLAVLPVRGEGLVLEPGFQVRFATTSLLVEVAPGGGAGGDDAGGGAGDAAREPFGGAAAPASGDVGVEGEGGLPGLGTLGDLGPPAGPGTTDTAPAAPSGPGVAGLAGATTGGGGSALAAGGRPLAGSGLVTGTGRARPWWRLVVVLPASALVGLATAAARRHLLLSPFWQQDRG